MIQNEISKFMALAPLIMPSLFDPKNCQELEIADDNAVIFFPFVDKMYMSEVMDKLGDEPELVFLYHGTNKSNSKIEHCCYFSRPYATTCMFKLNTITDGTGFAEGITATIFNEVDVMESALEDDLNVHASSFNFTDAITRQDVVSQFCKFS